MIYLQAFLIIVVFYFIIANYLKNDDLLDFESFFEKLFGMKMKDSKIIKVHNFHFEQPKTIEDPEIDNTAFNNSPWAWAVPMANEWPRLYLFESIESNLDSMNFKDKLPCPNCKEKSENLTWIDFKCTYFGMDNKLGFGKLSICDKCLIEVEYFSAITSNINYQGIKLEEIRKPY